MISLSAATITLLYTAKRDINIVVVSDSSTISRISKTYSTLADSATAGYGLTASTPISVHLRLGDELYAISTGTPNVTVFEPDTDYKPVI